MDVWFAKVPTCEVWCSANTTKESHPQRGIHTQKQVTQVEKSWRYDEENGIYCKTVLACSIRPTMTCYTSISPVSAVSSRRPSASMRFDEISVLCPQKAIMEQGEVVLRTLENKRFVRHPWPLSAAPDDPLIQLSSFINPIAPGIHRSPKHVS